jgi:hypothetical protein
MPLTTFIMSCNYFAKLRRARKGRRLVVEESCIGCRMLPLELQHMGSQRNKSSHMTRDVPSGSIFPSKNP